MSQLFAIPELGDANVKGSVANVLIEVGESVVIGQTLLEVETEKVVMEIPAEVAGVVDNIMLKQGDNVKAGTEFISITAADSASNTTDSPASEKVVAESLNNSKSENSPVPIQAGLATSADVVTEVISSKNHIDESESYSKQAPAGPSARRLARELGIDIANVSGSGPRQRISKQDVKAHVKKNLQPSQVSAFHERLPLPDLKTFGPINPVPLTGIQKATSRNMLHAVQRIPHAWLQEKIDITTLEKNRKQHKSRVANEGGALTLTALLCKILGIVMKEFPIFNAVLDDEHEQIIYKQDIHIGVAVDTPRGLFVPVIRHIDEKSVIDISCDLSEISTKARAGKLLPSDMQGAGMSISNLGGIGSSAVFPVINWPELAIIGVGASEWVATYIDTEDRLTPEPRLIMPMTLAFDHRVINGADGARFLQRVKTLCEDLFLHTLRS